jgi:hypothetical protein
MRASRVPPSHDGAGVIQTRGPPLLTRSSRAARAPHQRCVVVGARPPSAKAWKPPRALGPLGLAPFAHSLLGRCTASSPLWVGERSRAPTHRRFHSPDTPRSPPTRAVRSTRTLTRSLPAVRSAHQRCLGKCAGALPHSVEERELGGCMRSGQPSAPLRHRADRPVQRGGREGDRAHVGRGAARQTRHRISTDAAPSEQAAPRVAAWVGPGLALKHASGLVIGWEVGLTKREAGHRSLAAPHCTPDT